MFIISDISRFWNKNVFHACLLRNTLARLVMNRQSGQAPLCGMFYYISELSRILAERLSDGGLTPSADTNFLLTAYRGGSLPHSIKNTFALLAEDKGISHDLFHGQPPA